MKNQSNKDHIRLYINGLYWTYLTIGCVGGSILGFLSFGLEGLIFALGLAVLTSRLLRKGIRFIQSN